MQVGRLWIKFILKKQTNKRLCVCFSVFSKQDEVQSAPSDHTVGALGAVTLKMEEWCRKHAVQLRKCTGP